MPATAAIAPAVACVVAPWHHRVTPRLRKGPSWQAAEAGPNGVSDGDQRSTTFHPANKRSDLPLAFVHLHRRLQFAGAVAPSSSIQACIGPHQRPPPRSCRATPRPGRARKASHVVRRSPSRLCGNRSRPLDGRSDRPGCWPSLFEAARGVGIRPDERRRPSQLVGPRVDRAS